MNVALLAIEALDRALDRQFPTGAPSFQHLCHYHINKPRRDAPGPAFLMRHDGATELADAFDAVMKLSHSPVRACRCGAEA